MADVVYLAVTVLFFMGAAAFVRACERIIGPSDEPAAETFGIRASGESAITPSEADTVPTAETVA